MKLIGLSIENLRKIKAARLDFDGKHLVQIRGENGAGKSTVIDAIKYLITGSKEIPGDVVTHGESKAKIIGQIDEYTIKRSITTEGKSTLTIENKTGKMGSPQAFLDTISGRFLDPEWFANLSGPEKKKVLMDYLGIDFTEIDKKIAEAEQDRLIAGRELKAIGEAVPVEKVEEKSLKELLQKKGDIEKFNTEQKDRERKIVKDIYDLRAEMVSILNAGLYKEPSNIEAFENDLSKISKLYKEKFPELKKLPKPEPDRNTEEIEKEIADLEENNRKARAYQEYLDKKEAIEEKENEYKELDEDVKSLRQEKIDMVEKAELPVNGLSIGDAGLIHNGATDDNWSQSEALKIGILLAVAFSGELKTIYIKRGESMDTQSLGKLKELAEAHGFQIIMEIVDDSYANSGDGIIYLEEGEIVPGKAG